jgi:uncharacterized protein (TIGR03437 family)
VNGDLIGNVFTVSLSNTAPAFFLSGGSAIATDLKGNLISGSNMAQRGQTIILYANGLGPVNNQPASGEPAGASPLSQTTTLPVVTIGGQPAQVQFSGLVPSLPGLYQLNVTVPSGVAAGTQNMTVAIGGVTSPSATIPVQ